MRQLFLICNICFGFFLVLQGEVFSFVALTATKTSAESRTLVANRMQDMSSIDSNLKFDLFYRICYQKAPTTIESDISSRNISKAMVYYVSYHTEP